MEILARAVGRRKEAVAQVQIIKGTGLVMINNKPANDYLQNNSCAILAVQAPFEVFSANLNLSKKNNVFDKTNTLTTDVPTSNNNGFNAENAANQTMPKNAAAALTEIDTIIKVKGGGLKGQADAIRLGISRALCLLDAFPAVVKTSAVTLNSSLQTTGVAGSNNNVPALSTQTTQASETQTMVVGLKKQLKDKGYLTQDSRVKERRKYGLKKARKASQYHKR